MNSKNLLLVIVIIGGFFAMSRFWKSEDAQRPAPAEIESAETDVSDPHPNQPPTQAATPPQMTKTESGFLPTEVAEPNLFNLYKQKISEMGQCLDMIVKPLDPNEEFGFEALNKSIAPDLGDIVSQMEIWSATDIRTPSGEIRRIFLTNADPDDESLGKVLRYSVIQANGSQRELPVAKELAEDPNETLLASLESDGEVIGRSRSRRVYYENGDVLILSELNGKISSWELSHGGSTYNCSNTDRAKDISCTCQQND